MARILYVVSRPLQINTSASVRNMATISGLLENGNNVDLVTTLPDKNHIAFDSSMVLENLNCHYIQLRGVQSAARIGRRFKFLKCFHSFASKILKPNGVYDNLVGIVNHVTEIDLATGNYDYIISSSDPKSSHLFVDKLLDSQSESFKGKWIQIWGDPFFEDITLHPSIDKDKVFEEENRLLSKADKIIYVSRLTLRKQQQRYSSSASKMVYYPIPYNQKIITKRDSLNEKENVKIAYCGDYSSTTRNILPIYKAIQNLNGVSAIICGGSDLQLKELANITIRPRQPLDIVQKIESECDILIHLSNLHGSQIPGKLYQYSGTNKPILFVLDGDSDSLKSEFESYDRFVFAENNEKAIIAAIRSIITSSKEYGPVMAFSKKVIANKILSF